MISCCLANLLSAILRCFKSLDDTEAVDHICLHNSIEVNQLHDDDVFT